MLLKDFLSCLSDQGKGELSWSCEPILYVTSTVKERMVQSRQRKSTVHLVKVMQFFLKNNDNSKTEIHILAL